MEIGDELDTGVVGNTKTCATTPIDTRAQYVYWCFTLNNPDAGDGDRLSKLFHFHCKWFRFQEEVGAQGTIHFQEVCCFNGKMRLKQLKDYYSNKAHWEPTRSARANDYCCKTETATGKFWEKENKLANIKKELKELKKPILTKKITKEDLNEEQLAVANRFMEPCSQKDRHLWWFWENLGNWGKTLVSLYLIDNYGAIVLSGGRADCINGFFSYVKENERVPPIVIFDIPRCSEGHVSYNAIEQIKAGCIFNTKYETDMLRFDKPHVIVFANEEPDYSMMSADRWNVINLRPTITQTKLPGVFIKNIT